LTTVFDCLSFETYCCLVLFVISYIPVVLWPSFSLFNAFATAIAFITVTSYRSTISTKKLKGFNAFARCKRCWPNDLSLWRCNCISLSLFSHIVNFLLKSH